MSFDAKAWIAAHEPPTYIDRAGKTHTGRLWSHIEYLKWVQVFVSWRKGELANEAYEGELRKLIESMGFTAGGIDEMIALPSVALEEMLKGFFVLQRKGGEESPVSAASTPAPLLPSTSSQKIAPASESSAS